MYIDMNSYFASCEQQDRPELRGRPIGVVPFDSPTAVIIAPSVEAKKFGVKTGMRMFEAKLVCPQIIGVSVRPVLYRQYHIAIMDILRSYSDDVIPRSIDEAVMNMSSYRLVYKDFPALARQIKADIKDKLGEFVKCSIGIAPNSFLAKLATELQKPDGLVEITPENIDEQLAKLQLTDLPGIAKANEKRLRMIGINTPLEMRHASEALLRKAFGGVVGNFWHGKLNFVESGLHSNPFRTMSATRSLSKEMRSSKQSLESMLIALCTKLEQRLVKQEVFCKEVSFFIKYLDGTGWDTKVQLANPAQDGLELRNYIREKMEIFEAEHGGKPLFNDRMRSMGVGIQNFVTDKAMQYSLFDNRIKHDVLRKAMYQLKDKYGKNSVRKAAEMFEPRILRDAIGFGSVKDLDARDGQLNQYMLEED